MYLKIVKPIFDVTLAIGLLVILSPLFFLLVLLLALSNNGSVFFTQWRPGKKERLFKLIKFKSMNDKRDGDGLLLDDDKRMTKIGSWIRKLSLDELPQLINILKCDMSFVGPRPLLSEYLALYNDEQRRRHSVRPGITGWAQINGRNKTDWKSRFVNDIWYVDHANFILDVKILFLTLIKVFKMEGVNSSSTVTMERFTGNE
ncbi:MAG: sugar transferase [Cyclobacteriaceae bacterium]